MKKRIKLCREFLRSLSAALHIRWGKMWAGCLAVWAGWPLAVMAAEEWCELVGKELDWCYQFLESNWALRWALFISGIWLAFSWIRNILRRDNAGGGSLFVGIIVARFIWAWPGSWLRFCGLSLEIFLLAILCIAVAADIFIFIRNVIPRVRSFLAKDNNGRSGGSESYSGKAHEGLKVSSVSYVDDGRKDFAGNIAQLIRESNLNDEPFTIGISGEWGSGKTLVINQIRQELEKEMIVVDFFPWQSSSPSSLIEDFFKSISKAIHSRNHRLARNLENYADKLLALDIDKRLNFLAKIGRQLSGSYISINEAKDRIESDIQQLPKSLLVMIDDLDRLDADELFETIRLIRNTAHFKNMVYVVAYDHAYTARMLDRKGIPNAESYLEKIFSLSLPLPSFEQTSYIRVVANQLKYKYGEESADDSRLLQWLLIQIFPSKQNLLCNLLKSYRQAVGFASHLIANYELLKFMMPEYDKNLVIREWYLLQLISYLFPKDYRLLPLHPEAYLCSRYHNHNKVFEFNPDNITKIPNIEPYSLSDPSFRTLMGKLFPSGRENIPAVSISYEAKYYNYFALRILRNDLDDTEFDKLLNSKEPIPLILSEWKSHKPSIADSVSKRFLRQQFAALNRRQTQRYIQGLLLWTATLPSQDLFTHLVELHKNNFAPLSVSAAVASYKKGLELVISNPGVDAEVKCLMVRAQSPIPIDPREPDDSPIPQKLLTESKATEYFSSIVTKAFEEKEILNPNDLIDPKSTLCKILENSSTEEQFEEDWVEVKQYAIKAVIEQMDAAIANNSTKKGTQLGFLTKAFGVSDEEDDELAEQLWEEANMRMRRMFATDANLIHIINNWFDGTDAEKKRVISSLHLVSPTQG